nr:hypothetical protein CFP56_45444 [Quercus suber]
MRIRRDGYRSNMNGCPIFASGVFSPSRKQILEVKGFGGNNYSQSTLTRVAAEPNLNHCREIAQQQTQVREERNPVGKESSRSAMVAMESNVQDLVEANLENLRFGVTSNSLKSGANFEAILKDIDNEILGNKQSTNTEVKKIGRHPNGDETNFDMDSQEKITEVSKVKVGDGLEKGTDFNSFQMGWWWGGGDVAFDRVLWKSDHFDEDRIMASSSVNNQQLPASVGCHRRF